MQCGAIGSLRFLLFAYYLLYTLLCCLEVLDEVLLLTLQRGQLVLAGLDEAGQVAQYGRKGRLQEPDSEEKTRKLGAKMSG